MPAAAENATRGRDRNPRRDAPFEETTSISPRLDGTSVATSGCYATTCCASTSAASEPPIGMPRVDATASTASLDEQRAETDAWASQKKFLASAAKQGHGAGLGVLASACKIKLEEYGAFLGAGATREMLRGFREAEALGPGAVGLWEEFGLYHAALEDWRSDYWRYGGLTEYGHILLVGTLDSFKTWGESEACLKEVAGVPDGRLFAYIEHGKDDAYPGRGYITLLAAGDTTVSPTVSHGVGYAFWQDGDWYHGAFHNGKQHGRGTCGYPDGGSYDGEWAEGSIHGRGTFRYPDGGLYDGEWAEGSIRGKGKFTYPDGGSYVGEWAEGSIHGRGTFSFPDGSWYDGEWADGIKHGQGTFMYPRGGSYEGQWAEGKRHGRGTYSFHDGATYDGEFVADRRHGRGTFSFPDGASYDGEWAADKRHGRGTLTEADGHREQCVYDRGELSTAAQPGSPGSSCVLS